MKLLAEFYFHSQIFYFKNKPYRRSEYSHLGCGQFSRTRSFQGEPLIEICFSNATVRKILDPLLHSQKIKHLLRKPKTLTPQRNQHTISRTNISEIICVDIELKIQRRSSINWMKLRVKKWKFGRQSIRNLYDHPISKQ